MRLAAFKSSMPTADRRALGGVVAAAVSAEVNTTVENIGARRLHTVRNACCLLSSAHQPASFLDNAWCSHKKLSHRVVSLG